MYLPAPVLLSPEAAGLLACWRPGWLEEDPESEVPVLMDSRPLSSSLEGRRVGPGRGLPSQNTQHHSSTICTGVSVTDRETPCSWAAAPP